MGTQRYLGATGKSILSQSRIRQILQACISKLSNRRGLEGHQLPHQALPGLPHASREKAHFNLNPLRCHWGPSPMSCGSQGLRSKHTHSGKTMTRPERVWEAAVLVRERTESLISGICKVRDTWEMMPRKSEQCSQGQQTFPLLREEASSQKCCNKELPSSQQPLTSAAEQLEGNT